MTLQSLRSQQNIKITRKNQNNLLDQFNQENIDPQVNRPKHHVVHTQSNEIQQVLFVKNDVKVIQVPQQSNFPNRPRSSSGSNQNFQIHHHNMIQQSRNRSQSRPRGVVDVFEYLQDHQNMNIIVRDNSRNHFNKYIRNYAIQYNQNNDHQQNRRQIPLQENRRQSSRGHIRHPQNRHINDEQPLIQDIPITEFPQRRRRAEKKSKEKGLDQKEIELFLTSSYHENQVQDDENKKCSICLQEFKENQQTKFLSCFHRFCRECIDQWLQIKPRCPLCQKDLKSIVKKQQ